MRSAAEVGRILAQGPGVTLPPPREGTIPWLGGAAGAVLVFPGPSRAWRPAQAGLRWQGSRGTARWLRPVDAAGAVGALRVRPARRPLLGCVPGPGPSSPPGA